MTTNPNGRPGSTTTVMRPPKSPVLQDEPPFSLGVTDEHKANIEEAMKAMRGDQKIENPRPPFFRQEDSGIDSEGESQELPPVEDVPTTGRIRDRLKGLLDVRITSPAQVEISAANLRGAIDPALGHASIMLHKMRRGRLIAALPAGAALPGVWIARPEEIEAVAAPLSRIIARRLPEDSGIGDLLALSPDVLDLLAIAQALPEYVRTHKTYETALIATNGQPEGEPNV